MENDTSTLYPATPFKTGEKKRKKERKKKPTTHDGIFCVEMHLWTTSDFLLLLGKEASLDSIECRFVNRSRVVENGMERKSDFSKIFFS